MLLVSSLMSICFTGALKVEIQTTLQDFFILSAEKMI